MKGEFGDVATLVEAPIDGLVLDLGVSSPQIDTPSRGFSFQHDGPLDMRMSDSGETAAELIVRLPENELADMIYQYGEERFSRPIARSLKNAQPKTTFEAVEAVKRGVPRKAWPKEINVATRTFQALRIAVNDEMGEIDRGLEAAEKLLAPGGRMAIVSFHSLEDRRVKHFMREHAGRNPKGSRHLPEMSETVATLRLIDPQGTTATEAEIRANPRARSARLRVAERLIDGVAA